MASDLRKTLKLKVRVLEVKSLKCLSNKLNKLQRITFAYRYGKILDLLEVSVQAGALTALAQYYDPPLRCFTFQDFQLVPTLEEFEQILGYDLKNGKPYQYSGHYPSLAKVSQTFNIGVREWEDKKENKGGIKGFSREYLEGKAQYLAENGSWDIFMDMLALIIYGIVLFPNVEDFVDFAAIDVFLAFKHRGENPVPAVLADIYYTLNLRHEKKGGVIICCLSVLYLWFTSHMFKKGHTVEIRSNHEWAQSIASLGEKTISWYSREQEIEEMVYLCGNFPNVPLIGAKGCINYNPTLALRQLGYHMTGPPTEESTTIFVIHYMGSPDLEKLRKACRAWDRVVRKGRELGRRSCGATESYRQWIKNRVQEIKLPFRSMVPAIEEMSVQIPIDNEEVEKLKLALATMQEKKRKLREEVSGARQECEALQLENITKTQSLERVKKKVKIEEECKLKVHECLRAANKELGLRRQERNRALGENQQLKEMLKNSKVMQRSVQKQLDNLKQKLEKVVTEYSARIEEEKRQARDMTATYHTVLEKEREELCNLEDKVGYQKKVIEEFEREGVYWIERCSKLVWLADSAIQDIPGLLKKAEAMTYPLSMPVEISDFIKYCQDMMECMKKLM